MNVLKNLITYYIPFKLNIFILILLIEEDKYYISHGVLFLNHMTPGFFICDDDQTYSQLFNHLYILIHSRPLDVYTAVLVSRHCHDLVGSCSFFYFKQN